LSIVHRSCYRVQCLCSDSASCAQDETKADLASSASAAAAAAGASSHTAQSATSHFPSGRQPQHRRMTSSTSSTAWRLGEQVAIGNRRLLEQVLEEWDKRYADQLLSLQREMKPHSDEAGNGHAADAGGVGDSMDSEDFSFQLETCETCRNCCLDRFLQQMREIEARSLTKLQSVGQLVRELEDFEGTTRWQEQMRDLEFEKSRLEEKTRVLELQQQSRLLSNGHPGRQPQSSGMMRNTSSNSKFHKFTTLTVVDDDIFADEDEAESNAKQYPELAASSSTMSMASRLELDKANAEVTQLKQQLKELQNQLEKEKTSSVKPATVEHSEAQTDLIVACVDKNDELVLIERPTTTNSTSEEEEARRLLEVSRAIAHSVVSCAESSVGLEEQLAEANKRCEQLTADNSRLTNEMDQVRQELKAEFQAEMVRREAQWLAECEAKLAAHQARLEAVRDASCGTEFG
uniref:Pericentrin n=1 Tax=Macrostomum lignano TaxID=282301 RepID=A0A1I8GIM6_9PLAT